MQKAGSQSTISATCTTTGTEYYLCDLCDEEIDVTIAALGHDYKTEWSSNGINHWHDCQNAGCTVKGSDAAHTPNADDGDCTTAITCSVCNTQTTAAQEHAYKTEWATNGTNHWHNCKNVDCAVKDGNAAHIPGAPVTETTPQTCTACGYVIAPPPFRSYPGTGKTR